MENNRIEYDIRNLSKLEIAYMNAGIIVYSFLMVLLLGISIYYIFVMKTSQLSILIILAAYLAFYLFYLSKYLNGRKNQIVHAILENEVITAESKTEQRRINLSDVELCVGYSTNAMVSNVLITKDDYMVIGMSSVFVFSKDGARCLKPFYAIAKECISHAKRYENVVKSSRSKRHPWIRVPYLIFQLDCRSKRVEKYVRVLREKASKQ